MQQFLAEYGGQIIYAVFVIALVFAGMRYFYGCWPWEREKTWYVTRYAVGRREWLDDLAATAPTLSNPVMPDADELAEIAEKLKTVPPSNDSFEREETQGNSHAHKD